MGVSLRELVVVNVGGYDEEHKSENTVIGIF